MAVGALDTEPVEVMLMAEGDNLLAGDILVGHVSRPVHLGGNIAHEGQHNHESDDTRPGYDLEARMEDLGHASPGEPQRHQDTKLLVGAPLVVTLPIKKPPSH